MKQLSRVRADTVPVSTHLDLQGRELKNARPGLVTIKPVFDADKYEAVHIFVVNPLSPDYGEWVGSRQANDWVRCDFSIGGSDNAVDTLAELTAIPAVQRFDKARVFVKSTRDVWYYDASAFDDPATDPDDIAIPDDLTLVDPGRWFKIAPNEAHEISYDNTAAAMPTTPINVQQSLDVLAQVFRSVILTFPDTLAAGTALNIQTGVYSGGGPAAVDGDTITLPSTGAAFKSNGTILIAHNGQLLGRGSMIGEHEVYWVSTTQIAFDRDILAGNVISIRL